MARAITALNGRIPAILLRTVGTDVHGRPATFRLDAAASWDRMRSDGMPHDVADTYRDLDRQWDFWLDPPSGPGTAAYPGRSWHGEGLAVDARGACLTWLAVHGRSHGWTRPLSYEPWHFEYDPDRDQHRHREDDVMPTAREIVDELLSRTVTAGDEGLPVEVPIGALLGDIGVHARRAASAATRAEAAAVAAAGRAQVARDEIKLHREAARKGEE